MRVQACAALSVIIFADLVISDEVVAKLETSNEYGDGLLDYSGYGDYNESDYDVPGMSENLTNRLEELAGNADGIDTFLAALERVVTEGGDSVGIPEEIDPEEHNITLEDAFDRTENFLTEQMQEAQDLLSEIEDAIEESRDSPVALTLSKDRIMDIMESFTDAREDLKDYRRSQSIEQMYSYYYGDDESVEEEYVDEDDESLNEEENFEKEKSEITMRQSQNTDDVSPEEQTIDEEELVLHLEGKFEEEYFQETDTFDTGPTNSAEFSSLPMENFYDGGDDVEQNAGDAQTATTESLPDDISTQSVDNFYDVGQDNVTENEAHDGDMIQHDNGPYLGDGIPMIVFIAISIPFVVLVISTIIFSCWYRRSADRRSVTIRAKSLSEKDQLSRISVVSICGSDPTGVPSSSPAPSKLPSYLEVVSGNIQPLTYNHVRMFHEPQTNVVGDKAALVTKC